MEFAAVSNQLAFGVVYTLCSSQRLRCVTVYYAQKASEHAGLLSADNVLRGGIPVKSDAYTDNTTRMNRDRWKRKLRKELRMPHIRDASIRTTVQVLKPKC